MRKPGLYAIHEAILQVLRDHPDGISEGEMRRILRIPNDEMVQFGRRRRDLHSYYHIDKVRRGKDVLYILRGEKDAATDAIPIDRKLRAQVLARARGRCQMCGRTILDDDIKLEIDHKIPRHLGGQ